MHTYIPTYIHTYIPTYVHTHLHTYILEKRFHSLRLSGYWWCRTNNEIRVSWPLTTVGMRAPTSVSENVCVDDYNVSNSMVLSVCLRKLQALQNGTFFLTDCRCICYMRKSKAVKLAVPLDLVLNTALRHLRARKQISRSFDDHFACSGSSDRSSLHMKPQTIPLLVPRPHGSCPRSKYERVCKTPSSKRIWVKAVIKAEDDAFSFETQ